MDISVDVTEADRTRLRAVLGSRVDADRVSRIVLEAGAMEALAYATGEAVFSTMADLRMFRVRCLLKAGMTLDEAEGMVAALFKLSPSGARRIVASTLARYSVELRTDVDRALEAVLDAAEWRAGDSRWVITVPPGFVRERLLDMSRRSSKPNPENKYGAIWWLGSTTYAWLREQLDLSERPVPGS